MTSRIHARLDVRDLTCGTHCAGNGDCGRACALRRIAFTMHQHETLAIEAAPGSAGTTLLGILCGELPGSGRVDIAGRPAAVGDLALAGSLRGIVGPETVAELLTMALRFAGVSRRIARRGADAELDALGLGPLAELGLAELTRTESVRISVSAAALRGARYVAVESPDAGCAGREGEALVRGLFGIVARHECGLILTTSSTRVAAMADRTLWLRRGELIDVAAPRLVRVV